MILGAIDWTPVLVALIAAPPAFLIALASWKTSRSVGVKNGSGSLQDQLSNITKKQNSMEAKQDSMEHKQDQMEEIGFLTHSVVHDLKHDLVDQNERLLTHVEENKVTIEEVRKEIHEMNTTIQESDAI